MGTDQKGSDQKDTFYLPAKRSSDARIEDSAKRLAGNKVLSSMLETMPGGAMVLDPNRQIVASNRVLRDFLELDKAEDALGSRPGELLGCRLPETSLGGCGTSEECRYCGLVNTVVTAAKSGETKQGECRIALKNGDALDLAVGATPEEIEGESYVFVGIHGISGQKRQQVLEKTFVHDLMNTAGGIQGILHLLVEELADVDDSGLTVKSHRLAKNLIDEIQTHRQLVAAEKGDLLLQLSEIDIRSQLEETVALYSSHDVAIGRTLTLLGSCNTSIDSDASIFRRVVGNMVKNALEATPEGGEVTVEAVEEDTCIAFHVHNPAAMPPHVKAQIFQRSFSTKGTGRGIGTYSIKLLTERYLGGTVSFVSEEGEGTTFSFRLPKREGRFRAKETMASRTAPPSTVAKDNPATVPEEKLPHLRILVAEDNRTNQLITRSLLEKLGWEVEMVADGEASLEKLRTESFDVILMDIMMPRMDGLEATRAIRSLKSEKHEIPIVALTGGTSEAEKNACIEAGMDNILGKPFSREGLRDAILKALKR
jgi:CheY-like chemotaxis protein